MMAGQTPKPTPPAGFGRETFQAFARAATREDLLADMRAQAEAYFGGVRVELREASAQRAQSANGLPRTDQYQGSSRWVARP